MISYQITDSERSRKPQDYSGAEFILQAIEDFHSDLERLGEKPIIGSATVDTRRDLNKSYSSITVSFKGTRTQPKDSQEADPDNPPAAQGDGPDEDPYGMWPLGRPLDDPSDDPEPDSWRRPPEGDGSPCQEDIISALVVAVRKAAPSPAVTNDETRRLTAALRILQAMTEDEFNDIDRRRVKDTPSIG